MKTTAALISFTSFIIRHAAFLILLSSLAYAAPGDLDSLNANVIGGQVAAITVQPDGKTILAGSFISVLGQPRNYIARLNADGTLDAGFNPNANNNVHCVVVQADGKILLGGSFTSVGGTGRNYIARLNADGTLDAGFNPNANFSITKIVVQADGKVLLVGWFTSVGGTTRNYIARVASDGTLDAGFNPNATSEVYDVAVQADGKILLGGAFTTVSGTGRNYIARVAANGALDAGFNPNASGYVSSVAVQADGKILLGGNFTTVGGTGRNYIARVAANGSLDTGFNPNASGSVYEVVVQADGKILLAGGFTTVGGTGRSRIARLAASGTLDAGFNPNADDNVLSMAVQADGRVLLGGPFSFVGGTSCKYFARLINDPATQILSAVDATQVLWTRGGSAPDISQVTFELSTNGGGSYTPLVGTATRVGSTANWQLTGLSLPTSGQLRARGRTNDGSSGIVEQVASFGQDSDSDGLLDSWELTYWPTTTGHGSLDDSDHDGYAELLELALGLNPTLPSAGGLPPAINEGGYLTMTITKQTGATYEVQSAGSLLPAQPDSFSAATTTVLTNNPTTLKVRDNFLIGSSPPRFMRVKVTAAP